MVQNDAFPIKLTPEPENIYDPNAIAIYQGFNRIGYVAKDSQQYIREHLDKNLTFSVENKYPRTLKLKVTYWGST